jgi:hypothetical protein
MRFRGAQIEATKIKAAAQKENIVIGTNRQENLTSTQKATFRWIQPAPINK